MDQTKEIETQSKLKSATVAEPAVDERETDGNTGSLGDTQKENEKDASSAVPETFNGPRENESESESTDEIETDQKPFEMQAAVQPAEELAEAAKAYEGQGAQKIEVSDSDNASGIEDIASTPAAGQSDEDPQIAAAEAEETDLPEASEPDDGNVAAGNEPESAQAEKQTQLPEKRSDDIKEVENPNREASDDPADTSADQTSGKDKDRDQGQAVQEPAGNDHTDKDQSEAQPDDAQEETEDLLEIEPPKKLSWVKAALTVILLAAVFSGLRGFEACISLTSSSSASDSVLTSACFLMFVIYFFLFSDDSSWRMR